MKRKCKNIVALVLCVALILQGTPIAVYAKDTITYSESTVSGELDENIVEILGEDISKREECSKQFRMSDGSYMAVSYGQPVHFLDDNNGYVEIDNTLVKTTIDSNQYYKNNNSSFEVILPESLNNEIKLEYKSNQISIKPLETKCNKFNVINGNDILKNKYETELSKAKSNTKRNEIKREYTRKAKNNYSKIVYNSAFENTDLQYEISGTKLKESIIINKKSAQKSYVYEIKCDSLTANKKDDNTVILSNSANEEVYNISSPYMFDSADQVSNDIDVSLTKISGGYLYTITPNNEWLNSSERQYPITIDPTIVPAYNATNIKDNSAVYTNYSNGVNGYQTPYYLRVGKNEQIGNYEHSALIYAEIPYNIPATAQIISAECCFAVTSVRGPAQNVGVLLEAFKITSDWNTANINEDIALFYDTTPSIPTYDDQIPLDYIYASNSEEYRSKYHNFDITKAAQSWLSEPNYGIIIKMPSQYYNQYNYVRFYSSDYGQNEPAFIYYYRDTTGIENYWSYHTQTVPNAGTGSINDFNGNLTFELFGFDYSNQIHNFSLSSIYNSNHCEDSSTFGNGWNLNLIQTIDYEQVPLGDTTSGYYYYIDGDGTKHYFYDDDGIYKDEDGLGYEYEIIGISGDELRHKITTKDHTVLLFDTTSAHHLREITDNNGNTLHINYNSAGYLTTITDYEDTVLYSINYTSNYGKISSITENSTNRSVNFVFDANDNLTSVTRYYSANESNIITLNYSNNLLTSVSNDVGDKIVYDYENNSLVRGNTSVNNQYGRVTQITEFANNTVNGQTMKIEYNCGNSTVFENGGTDGNISTQADNNKLTYQFDKYGQVTAVYKPDGSAAVRKYNDGIGNQHQLSLNSQTQKITRNLLTNPNFEDVVGTDNALTHWNTTANASISRISLAGVTSNYGASFVKTGGNTPAAMYQEINLDEGVYTFSIDAYIKTANADLEIAPCVKNITAGDSDFICSEDKITKSAFNRKWERITITFAVEDDNSTVQVGIKVTPSENCTYFILNYSKAQLENNDFATKFNWIDDNSFVNRQSGVQNKWTVDDGTWNVVNESVLKCTADMATSVTPQMSQLISVNGDEKDVYILSGWGKAASLPVADSYFKIDATINYSDGTHRTFTLNFNKNITDWQFGSVVIITNDNDPFTEKKYESISIKIIYSNQMCDAYFDDIQLIKDDAQSYTYDSNGNVISVKTAVSEESFKYDGNSDLIKQIDAKGYNYQYHYDTKHNLITASNSDGLTYNFVYNSKGLLENSYSYIGEMGKTLENNGTYYMRVKSTGEYLDVSADSDSDNANLQQYRFYLDEANHIEQYQFVSVGDGYYRIIAMLSATGRSVTVQNNSTQSGANAVISTYNGADNQKFRLKYVGEGGYIILAKNSNDRLALCNETGASGNWVNIAFKTVDENDSNQIWHLEKVENITTPTQPVNGKVYCIRSAQSTGKYIDINELSTADDSEALYGNYNGGANQLFKFVKVSGTDYWNIYPMHAPNMKLTEGNSKYQGYWKISIMSNNTAGWNNIKVVNNPNKTVSFVFEGKPERHDISAITTTSDIKLITTNYDSTNTNQQWYLEEVDINSISTAEYTNGSKILSTTTDTTGTTMSYSYDNANRLVTSVSIGVGNNTQTASYTYDSKDRITGVSSGVSNVTYRYMQNNLSAITHKCNDNDSVSYDFEYDAFGNVTKVKVGSVALSTNTYNPYTNTLAASVYGNGNTVSYTYDKDGKVLTKTYNNNLAAEYSYDDYGNLTKIDDLQSDLCYYYTYDSINRLLSVRCSNGSGYSVSYDQKNRASVENYWIGDTVQRIDFVYNSNDCTKSDSVIYGIRQNNRVLSAGSDIVSYEYDDLLRRNKKTIEIQTPFASEYSYVAGINGTKTGLVSSINNGGDVTDYDYDDFGNISKISNGNPADEIEYEYDNLNQLCGATFGGHTYVYSYDNGGNILSVKEDGSSIKTYEYNNSNWKDLLTKYNGVTITYDAIGNPLSYRNGLNFTWSNGRQLTGVTNSSNTVSYANNFDGKRIQKTVNGVTTDYYWLNGILLGQKTGNQVIIFLYDESGSAYGMLLKNGSTEEYYYYIYNAQGDIVGILDNNGQKVAQYTYNPWGEILSVKDGYGCSVSDNTIHIGNINPLRYRGYYYDAETGLYYCGSRYYDPETGRWLNADSVIDQSSVVGSNLFVYCLNNPVNMADETGNLPFFAITAAIGAVVGAVAGGVVAAKNGRNVWAGIGIGAAAGALIGTGVGMAAGAALAGSIVAPAGAVIAGGSALVSTVATGGMSAGVTFIANNLRQAGDEISNAIATVTQKIVSKTPANPGKPFETGKTGIQSGVDPNTLIPQKDLATLNPQRMADAVRFGGDQAVRVGRTGVIYDGHHRVADAIMNGRAIDVFVEPFK